MLDLKSFIFYVFLYSTLIEPEMHQSVWLVTIYKEVKLQLLFSSIAFILYTRSWSLIYGKWPIAKTVRQNAKQHTHIEVLSWGQRLGTVNAKHWGFKPVLERSKQSIKPFRNIVSINHALLSFQSIVVFQSWCSKCYGSTMNNLKFIRNWE